MWGKYPLPWRMLNKKCPNFHTEFMQSTIQYSTKHMTNNLIQTQPQQQLYQQSNYLSYGLECDYPGFIKQPNLVKKRFILSSANFTPELYDRSIAWYGQPPLLHIEWLKLYDTTATAT